MTLATVIQEKEYPQVMNWELAEMWADGIPVFSENNPLNPEWKKTPAIRADFTFDGYGVVDIKNEADKRSNPTQTIKDRAAWELATLFRDFARILYLKKKKGSLNGNIEDVPVPRFCYVTAGNMGTALSVMFKQHNLPPMKLLVDKSIKESRLTILKHHHADIYMADLSKESLTTEDIKKLTNNENGIDITSVVAIEPHARFYDWHVHEAFNEKPDEIFVPYGSGRLMENYLTWQARNMREKDLRLTIPIEHLAGISILGAEPLNPESVADKLTKSHNPFVMLDKNDMDALASLSFTGENTGIYHVPEQRIVQAYIMMGRYCETEPSAAAGLALYFQRFDEGKINPRHKVLIVNTGSGI